MLAVKYNKHSNCTSPSLLREPKSYNKHKLTTDANKQDKNPAYKSFFPVDMLTTGGGVGGSALSLPSLLAANRISSFPKSNTATTFFRKTSPRKFSTSPSTGSVAAMP